MLKFNKILRWAGKVVLALLLLLVAGYMYIYIRTEQRINRKYSFSEPAFIIPSDSLAIVKGRHLYQIRNCIDCHGPALAGGVFMDDAILLQLTAPNLTKGKGGLPADFSAQDWVRVLRHGVDKNGRPLWLMPSHESTVLSKEDLSQLIAYCQSMPPVDSQGERLKKMGPLGRVLMMLDEVAVLPAERIDHQKSVTASTPKDTIAFGQYLATTCQSCHRHNLKGGPPPAPGYPPVPDISATGAPGNWSKEEFIGTLRNGKTPEGNILRNEFMPWQNMKHFSDDELNAIRSYLLTLY